MDSFLAGPCETFDPHYGTHAVMFVSLSLTRSLTHSFTHSLSPSSGVGGYQGDGDVTRLDNLLEFQKYVQEQTDGDGVHFVMAGGVRRTVANSHDAVIFL